MQDHFLEKLIEARHLLGRVWHVVLLLLIASGSMRLMAASKFDPLDPLGNARKEEVTIEVTPGDWGHAKVMDIRVVLVSAAKEFLSHVNSPRADLSIRVIPRAGSPKVRYERGPEGQYVIQLTARDDRWHQYAYQFIHELCHVLSNFDRKKMKDGKVAEENQWFEESLCETASLFTLKRLVAVWATNPPRRNWMGYDKAFAAYAERLLGESHRHLNATQSFPDWYAQNQSRLRADPYLREENELVAANLLPLFEQHPELWQAITYLNSDETSASKPFAAYLTDWCTATPDKTLPREILRLFWLDSAGQPLSRETGRPADNSQCPAGNPPTAN